jgi:hypothetical protein
MPKLGSNQEGPSAGKWLNELWYIYIRDCLSELQRNKLSSLGNTE